MKICFFLSDFPPRKGGISTFNHDLVFALAKQQEIELVEVFSFFDKKTGVENLDGKVVIQRFQTRSSLFISRIILKEIVKGSKNQIFHALNLFPVGFFAVLFARVFGKLVFTTVYGTDIISKEGSVVTKFAKIITLKLSSHVSILSNSTARLLLDKINIPPQKYSVCLYPLPSIGNFSPDDKKNIRILYKINDDDFVILTVCTLVKRKGVADLIKALSKVKNNKAKLVIVGDGPERGDLEKLAKELKIQDRVVFTGKVEETLPFYAIADIFALASFFYKEKGDVEGLGIVLLEAQRFGVPVIGTKSGGIPETMKNGETGFLVPEHDVDDLADRIEFLMENPEGRLAMGELAKKFVLQKFNEDKIAKRLIENYKLILAGYGN